MEKHYSATSPQSLSTLQLIIIGLAGCSHVFTTMVFVAYGTPTLLSIGVPKSWTSILGLAWPIVNFLKPMLGSLSDKHISRIGRRRPFIMLGTSGQILGLLIFAYVKEIGSVVISGSEDARRYFMVTLAVSSYIIYDVASVLDSVGTGALVVDGTPPHQQKRASAVHAVMGSTLSLTTLFLGTLDLSGLASDSSNLDHVKIMTFLGCIARLTCVAITCIFAREGSPRENEETTDESSAMSLRKFITVVRYLPKEVKYFLLMQLFSGASGVPLCRYGTTWVGQYFTGRHDPFSGDLKEAAQRRGTLAMMLMEVTKLVTQSITMRLLTKLSNRRSAAKLLVFEFAGAALVLGFTTFFVWNDVELMIVLMLLMIPWGAGGWMSGGIFGEYVNDMQQQQQQELSPLSKARQLKASKELLYSADDLDTGTGLGISVSSEESGLETRRSYEQISTGTLMGVESLVFQIGSCACGLLCALIFHVLDSDVGPADDAAGIVPGSYHDSVGWVMRLGGLLAIPAAIFASRLNGSIFKDGYQELRSDENEPSIKVTL